MKALNTFIGTAFSKHERPDILVLSETKSSVAKTYHYVHREGWSVHLAHKNTGAPKKESGGVALFIRNGANITVHEPEHLPADIHTCPENGIATWILKNETWDQQLPITACYWPDGRVPTTKIDSQQDHIKSLYRLLNHQKKHRCPNQPHHIIMGDFNLHLASREEGVPTAAADTNASNNTSNQRLAQAIVENQYHIISPTPQQGLGPPYTWYKTNNQDDGPKSTVDYVFGNLYTYNQTKACKIMTNTRANLKTDHEAIHTSIYMTTGTSSCVAQAVGTRKYDTEQLGVAKIRQAVQKRAQELAPD